MFFNSFIFSAEVFSETVSTVNDKLLFKSIAIGDISGVNNALSKGANVNAIDKNENTPLQLAIIKNNIDIVRVLIKNGANTILNNGSNLVWFAASIDNPNNEIIELLLKHCLSHDINLKLNEPFVRVIDLPKIGQVELIFYPLLATIEKNNINLCERLISLKADVNVQPSINGRRLSLLKNAIRSGFTDIAKSLLKANADILPTDSLPESPLVLAIIKKNFDITQLLINLKADVNKAQGEENLRPIHNAVIANDISIVDLLIKSGCEINSEAIGNITPLALAIAVSSFEISDFLIKSGAKTDVKDANNETLLHIAARQKDVRFVEMLINSGISVDSRDNKNRNSLFYALKNGDSELIKVLLANSSDKSKSNEIDAKYIKSVQQSLNLGGSNNKLIFETLTGNRERVIELINADGLKSEDINKQDKSGMTALMYAVVSGDEELVKSLLKLAYTKQTSIVNSLLSKIKSKDIPINILLTNNNGETALTLANKYNKQNIAEILYEALLPIINQLVDKLDEINVTLPRPLKILIAQYLYGSRMS